MNYFKMYGYISCAQAVYFSGDLKLAHYTKIPPRHTFWCQMVATLVSTFVCTAIFNFQMAFRDVCTDNAAFNFYCPGEQTFFTASVFWGTIGPRKIFGPGGHFTALLAGFPVGFILPFITFGLARKFPRVGLFRQLHPVMICAGAINWAPYNISYLWPSVIITWISWGYIKKRYLAFWTKYNYVLAAAFTAGLAVAAIIIFFAVQLPGVEIDWWGNDPSTGCSADICTRLEILRRATLEPTRASSTSRTVTSWRTLLYEKKVATHCTSGRFCISTFNGSNLLCSLNFPYWAGAVQLADRRPSLRPGICRVISGIRP